MDQREKQARLRDKELREEFAIGRAERRLAREEREMERRLNELEDAEERAERAIEQEWRREHWGREPEHPAVWPNRRSAREHIEQEEDPCQCESR
jgi:hypothetical protein